MKYFICFLSMFFFMGELNAEDLVQDLPWSKLKSSGHQIHGNLTEQEKVLKVEGTGFHFLFHINKPEISKPIYAIKGQIKYDQVEGEGYLEMLNYFDGNKAYFSRSLASKGPSKKLSGSSNWRDFTLPFFMNQGKGSNENFKIPHKIEFKVVLPKGGNVYLKDLSLFQYNPGENPMRVSGQWWGNRKAGLWGGLFGALVGCLGGLIGVLTSLGKAKNFILNLMKVLTGLGVLSILAGIYALFIGQPYVVYYPLLLLGVITSLVLGLNLKTIQKRYEKREIQKMKAMDLSA